MKVTFKNCTTWSMDGINPKKYEEGEVAEVNQRNYDLLIRNELVTDTGEKVIKVKVEKEEKAMPKPVKNKMFEFAKKTKKSKK